MGLMLAFAPFVIFAVLDRYLGPVGSLTLGALASAALIVRGRLQPAHSFKILEVGTFVLFAALAIYLKATAGALSIIAVRLCVDAGLFVIVLTSIVVRRPFTIEYAREQVPEAYWKSPQFLKINYTLTAGWAVAFGVIVIAETCLLFVPALPQGLGIGVVVAALVGAFAFTKWYPSQAKPSGR